MNNATWFAKWWAMGIDELRKEWAGNAFLESQAGEEIRSFVECLMERYRHDLELMHLRGQLDRHQATHGGNPE